MTRWKILLATTILLGACLSGCGTRVVFVKDGDPLRLAQPLKNIKVWVKGADGKWVLGRAEVIPEGWYCIGRPAEK